MKPGFLLALEGIDGSGKSTAALGIAATLRADGHDVVPTREPTDGPWGRRIREMAKSGETVAPEEELRWFLEDRREHVAERIGPALEAGRIVVTDRYFLSTVAYQGARGLDWRALLKESEAEFPSPDLALIFEVDAATGLERARGRAGPHEPSFEEGGFLTRVAEVYAAVERPWLARVDASLDPPALLEACLRRIRSALSEVAG